MMSRGLQLWNEPVFTDNFQMEAEGGAVVGIVSDGELLLTTEINAALRQYKGMLEELQKYNTPGKLRNLKMSQGDAISALSARDAIARAEDLVSLVRNVQSLTTYLAEAQGNLPPHHPWSNAAAAARRTLIDEVRRFGRGAAGARPETAMTGDLQRLKNDYIAAYATLHREAVLGAGDDERRRGLYDDPRLKAMDAMATIDLLGKNTGELDGWKEAIRSIPTCREFHEGLVASSPTCPSCHYRPSQRQTSSPAASILANLDDRLTTLHANWRRALRSNLESDAARASLANMPMERAPVDAFLAGSDDDPTLPAGFANAATTALRGLEALPIQVADVVAALENGGLPCTVDEFKDRFDEFVRATMRGHDPRGTRLTLERSVAQILAAAD